MPTLPTATKFESEGVDNGFPFCLPKVDVSGYDYWITLGGFKKGDAGTPTNKQIADSLTNAMRLFWNLDGWTGRLFYADGGPDSYEITSMSMENDDWSDPLNGFIAQKLDGTSVNAPDFEPKNRACYKGFEAVKGLVEGQADSIALNFYSLTSNFVRMYDGVVTDEDNFVGYGFNWIFVIFNYEAFELTFSSYSNGTPASPTQTDEDISYVQIPTNITGITIPAVGFIEQFEAWEIPTDFDTYSWSNLEFSAYDETFNIGFEFSITSLDFWTYPV